MAMASPGNGDGTPSWKSFHGAMPSTRRTVVAGLAAALAAPFPGPARAAAVSAPLKVGDIELRVVSDGTLAAPRAFALPQTPPGEVEALYRAHGAEAPPQFVSQTNATLARIGGELILVDAGSGPNFQATAGRLSQNLEGPASIRRRSPRWSSPTATPTTSGARSTISRTPSASRTRAT